MHSFWDYTLVFVKMPNYTTLGLFIIDAKINRYIIVVSNYHTIKSRTRATNLVDLFFRDKNIVNLHLKGVTIYIYNFVYTQH